MAEKIVLIDGNSIINRAFYGVPDLTNSEGKHTNAVYGFLNIMFKILDEETPDYLLVAFDVKHPTFRHKRYPEYKGTRKPMPDELAVQVPLLKEMLSAMGIARAELPGYEADDILGTVAKQCEEKGITVSLISGDRDMLQLATDNIKIRIPKTKRGVTEIENYNTAQVIETYGVTPAQIIDLKGLMGDSSDNIPGVPGIGEKGASKIIRQFGSVEAAIEHVEDVTPQKAKKALEEHSDLARLSKELAAINIQSPIEYSLEECRLGNLYTPQAYALVKQLEFKSMFSRFSLVQVQKKKETMQETMKILTDLEQVEKLFLHLQKKGKETADFTVGLAILGEGDWFFGLGISTGEKETYVICADGMFLSRAFLLKRAGELLEGNCHMAVHRLKVIFPFFWDGEGSLDRIADGKNHDLSLMAYLCNPLRDSYEMDDIAREFGQSTASYAERFGKAGLSAAAQADEKKFAQYGAELAYLSWALFPELAKRLDSFGMTQLYQEIELPLTFTLYEMEKRGILINESALKVYGSALSERIRVLEQEIYTLAGEEFNINSPKQLGVILFEKLKMPYGKKTKTGYSTAADILEKLQPDYPLVGKILEYRQLTKLKSTYADGLVNFISPDGRIHGKFHQTITATGRISSAEPNLQNIPIRMEIGREIRKVFVPEKGYVFLDADYSQIELRVLAHMSEDETLIEAYKNAEDIHAITASQVFHVSMEELTPLQRRNAKAVNFGIIYGISSFGLGQDLNISRKEAEEYMKQYFSTYPKIKEFLDGLVARAKKEGVALTIYGRRRPVPELRSGNFMQRSFGERIAMNSPIQGTAADIIKIAMNRVNQALKDGGYKSRLLLQVHDELLVEAAIEEIEDVSSILIREMQNAAQLHVPLIVDMKQGKNWYEAH